MCSTPRDESTIRAVEIRAFNTSVETSRVWANLASTMRVILNRLMIGFILFFASACKDSRELDQSLRRPLHPRLPLGLKKKRKPLLNLWVQSYKFICWGVFEIIERSHLDPLERFKMPRLMSSLVARMPSHLVGPGCLPTSGSNTASVPSAGKDASLPMLHLRRDALACPSGIFP